MSGNKINDSKDESTTGSRYWFFTGIGILALGIGGFLILASFHKAPAAVPRVVQVPLVRTLPVEFETGNIPVKGNGLVRPRAAISLSAQVAGEVVSMSAQMIAGGKFQGAELLIKLDDRQYLANLKRAEASRKSTVARLSYVRQRLKRTRALVEKGTLQQDELDRELSEEAQLLADLAAGDAAITRARLDLEHTIIKAPFSGSVVSENIDVGQFVQPGQELARLFAGDEMEISVQLDDSESGLIAGLWNTNEAGVKRARAVVYVEYGQHTYAWSAYVHRAEATLDRDARTVNVVVRVNNPGQAGKLIDSDESARVVMTEAPPLLVGMYATVSIEGVYVDNYIRIPRAALRDHHTIWTVSGEGKLEIIPLEIVFEEDDEVFALGRQLEEGTPVIVSKLPVFIDGMPVKILPGSNARLAPGVTSPQ